MSQQVTGDPPQASIYGGIEGIVQYDGARYFDPIKQDTQPTVLRDYFAAQILRGMLANANWDHLDNPETQDKLVRVPYQLADKLLVERVSALNQAISNITKF